MTGYLWSVFRTSHSAYRAHIATCNNALWPWFMLQSNAKQSSFTALEEMNPVSLFCHAKLRILAPTKADVTSWLLVLFNLWMTDSSWTFLISIFEIEILEEMEDKFTTIHSETSPRGSPVTRGLWGWQSWHSQSGGQDHSALCCTPPEGPSLMMGRCPLLLCQSPPRRRS